MKIALFTYWFTWRQRPHHFAEALSEDGYTIEIFSTRSIANYFRGIRRHSLPNMFVGHLRSIYPVFPSPLFDDIFPFIQFSNWQSRRLLHRFSGFEADAHVYATAPIQPLLCKPSLLVYDCMDDWSDFPHLSESVIENERRLCQMADRIWVVSEHLYRKFEPEFGAKLEYVPNGVEYEHFAITPQLKVLRSRPVLGYVGTLYAWFDVHLVAAVADALPEWDIVLVGPVVLDAQQRQVLTRPNIHFLGRQPYEDLPAILARFDVTMIPFILNDLIRSTSPIKLYEYLAAGLPVISTSMPEVLPFQEEGVVICADEPDAFVQAALKLRCMNTSAMVERRQQIARQHTWQARFEKALGNLGLSHE